MSLQQYQVLLDSIPAINAQLRERGDEVKDPAFNPSTGVAKGADEEAGGRDEDEDEKEKEVADEEEEEDASE